MGPNQLFQRLVLLEQNDYWIGGQTWHGDLLSPLRIRHATTQPIRLLKTLHPRWSQNFFGSLLVSSSASHGNGRAVPSRAIGVKPGVASPLKFGLAIVDRELKSAGLLGNVEPTRSRSSLRVWRQLARLRRRLRSLHRALARAPPSRRSRLDNRAGLDPRPRLRAQARHLRRRLFLGGVASYRSDARCVAGCGCDGRAGRPVRVRALPPNADVRSLAVGEALVCRRLAGRAASRTCDL